MIIFKTQHHSCYLFIDLLKKKFHFLKNINVIPIYKKKLHFFDQKRDMVQFMKATKNFKKGIVIIDDYRIGVGKTTLEGSLKCLSIRGMMVSFGNASGALSPIDVPKLLQPKGLYFIDRKSTRLNSSH